jgi:hypothetical protein
MKYPPGLSTLLSSNSGFPPAIPSGRLIKQKKSRKIIIHFTKQDRKYKYYIILAFMDIVKK